MAKNKKQLQKALTDIVGKQKQRLIKALSYLKDGKGVDFLDDTFLVGKEQDGSDKMYGIINRGGELLCITRECSSGYPIRDMDDEDIDYIFDMTKMFEKIKDKKYPIVLADHL